MISDLLSVVGINHEELVSLAKQHLSGVSFEYPDDAVPLLSPCRFTGSEVRIVYMWGKNCCVWSIGILPVFNHLKHDIKIQFNV